MDRTQAPPHPGQRFVHVPTELSRLGGELRRLERSIAATSLRPHAHPAVARVLLGTLWQAHEVTRGIQDAYLDGCH